MNVRELVSASFQDARAKNIEESSPRTLHNRRSMEWVESLATRFRDAYVSDKSIRVFSRHSDENRKDFGVNELLYDVTVASVGSVESAFHKKKLFFVKESLWQIESEFARDCRQALIDFNKLVLGSAKNKLFIGPHVKDHDAFIKVLIPAAAACSGEVYAAFIPHPDEWDAKSSAPEVFQFDKARKQWDQYK